MSAYSDMYHHHGVANVLATWLGMEYDRLLNSTQDDLFGLPPERLERPRDGPPADLGSDGFQDLLKAMSAREQANRGQTSAASAASSWPPNYLKTLEQHYPDQAWGFVVFRTSSYDDDERSGGSRSRTG
ncbi:MAG: hypothetical protein M1816_003892 [Peltula sp. TS41687]|nr:MAG: hypothetical protein M1816_003892 [Peltula sp. TS41687]